MSRPVRRAWVDARLHAADIRATVYCWHAGDLDTKNTVDIMDLLLSINQNEGITCVMVTHNPDLECYADRILYVSDGMVSVLGCGCRHPTPFRHRP